MRAIGRKFITGAALIAATLGASGCTTIRDPQGYVVDPLLVGAIHEGIDNRRSVEATLGRPTFTSQFGEPTWYYVSSTTTRKPFGSAKIRQQLILEIRFDDAGNVAAVERGGIDQVVYLSPEDDQTPTLGRDRSFLEDLFGNIGVVGAAAGQGAGAPGRP